MSVIRHEMEIDASPEAVFELMARMEAFAACSEAIESITRVGPDRYRWCVRVAEVPLVFDVEVLVPVPRACWAGARWPDCPARAAIG